MRGIEEPVQPLALPEQTDADRPTEGCSDSHKDGDGYAIASASLDAADDTARDASLVG